MLLNCGAPVKRNLEEIWPHLPNLEWLHSTAAGVEHILFPALIDGPVTLTNAKAGPSGTLHDLALEEYLVSATGAQEMRLQGPHSLMFCGALTCREASRTHSLSTPWLLATGLPRTSPGSGRSRRRRTGNPSTWRSSDKRPWAS